MKFQFKLLLFLVALNLVTTLVMVLGLPGTDFVSASATAGNSTEYQERFNSSEIAEDWRATGDSGLPVVGDVFSGFYFFFSQWEFLISGFSYLLRWIGDSYLTTANAQTTFALIASVLTAIYHILLAVFMIYLITGRDI